jgi:TetR/AcrR family transcriptional regulator, transcriptional repressor for nem operon
MPRAREFDPDDALQKAMSVFWQKGYANTSIDDLVDATGVNRYGLYGEFESKRGLFLACLDHYQETVVEEAFGVVEQPDASLKNIRAYFVRLLEPATTEQRKLGCLMVNTASDVAPYDKRAANKVEKFRSRLQTGFDVALSNAKARGELHDQFNTGPAADFLTGVAQGLSVMSRSHADPKMMANVVETTLACLK